MSGSGRSISRRSMLIGGAAGALALGAGAWALGGRGGAPEPAARRLHWSDLRPASPSAEREGLGLSGFRSHASAVAADRADGGALYSGPEAPFSWDAGPARASDLVTALDGAWVALPGYVVPLNLLKEGTTEFLLAPFVGACIHVPPPPPNQIVLVNIAEPHWFDRMFEAVAVTGVMRVEPASSRLAEVGYQLEARRIASFDPEQDGAAWSRPGEGLTSP